MKTDIITGNVIDPDAPKYGNVDPNYPRAGVTYASQNAGKFHIEYFAPDGTFYLWYADYPVPIAGEWWRAGTDLCYRIKTGSKNPRDDRGSCGSTRVMAYDVVAMTDGDPYGLQRGTLPSHDLSTCRLPPGMKLARQMTGCMPGLYGF